MNHATNTASPAECAFCGCAMNIKSNSDWHHLTGEHSHDCPFEADEDTMCVPATRDSLAWMLTAWNRRATQASAEPVRHEMRLIAPKGNAGPWCACDADTFAKFMTDPDVGDGFKYEVRRLFDLAAPSSAPSTEPTDAERIAHLEGEEEISEAVIAMMSRLLASIAITIKGEEEALKRHSYHELAELVQVMALELDLYKTIYGDKVPEGWENGTAPERAPSTDSAGEAVAYMTADKRMLIFADVFENNADSSPEGMTPLYAGKP